jgi:hypothetical protein
MKRRAQAQAFLGETRALTEAQEVFGETSRDLASESTHAGSSNCDGEGPDLTIVNLPFGPKGALA